MSAHEYPERPRVAVGTVVVRDDAVLLVKRKHPPNQGLWAIPGGTVELGETLQEAAERELLEETGVVARAERPIYVFDTIRRDAAQRVRYHYVIADVLARYLAGEPEARDDALEARWVRASELDAMEVSESTLELLRETLGFDPSRPGT